MEEKIEIEFEEVNEEEFSAYVSMGEEYYEVEGSVWTDEQEELYGDQVSSVHLVAYFDELGNIKRFNENGNELNSISLDAVKAITKELKNRMDEEIDSSSCHVDYSPKYYDLV
jgi:hypothetical protein